jgi:hypothetical protein
VALPVVLGSTVELGEVEVAEGASVMMSEVAVAVLTIEEAAITSDVDNSVEAVAVVEVVSVIADEALPVSDVEVAVAVESVVIDERMVIGWMILDVTGTSTIPSEREEDGSTLLDSAAVVLTSLGVFEVVVVFKTTSLLLLASEFIID